MLSTRSLDHAGIVGRVAQLGIDIQFLVQELLHALVIADLLGGVLAAENAQVQLFRRIRCGSIKYHHRAGHQGGQTQYFFH
jgi:hypothetical protein